jgi:F0F1-type ATP synthase assembly protein I
MDNSGEDRAFLISCFGENLAHARHIETERITFFSLYLVGVGMLLGKVLDTAVNPVIGLLLSVLLLIMSAVCVTLLRRWNQVFESHRRTARALCDRLRSGSGDSNDYFYFDNRASLSARRQKYYLHTSTLFLIFALSISAVEVFAFVLNVLRLVGLVHGV